MCDVLQGSCDEIQGLLLQEFKANSRPLIHSLSKHRVIKVVSSAADSKHFRRLPSIFNWFPSDVQLAPELNSKLFEGLLPLIIFSGLAWEPSYS